MQDRNRAKQLNEVLNQQMNEKKMVKEGEMKANKSYMHRWAEAMQVDDLKRVEAEKQRQDKIRSNQTFLKQ